MAIQDMNVVLEKLEKYDRLMKQRREAARRYRHTERGKKLDSINKMIKTAREKGDLKRVAELEERKRKVMKTYKNTP